MTINQRILVVDDDEQLLNVYRNILEPRAKQVSALAMFTDEVEVEPVGLERAFELATALQGVDAVTLVEQSLVDNRPFAVAFVDIRMPPGIDGLETARRIRDLDDRIYIIFVTAYSDRGVDEIQQTIQHDVLLTRKPLTRDEILQLAHNACNRWTQDQQLVNRQLSLEQQVQEHAIARLSMESLVSSLSEGLVVCDAGGMITSSNPAAAAMSRYDEEDILGMSVGGLFPDLVMEDLLSRVQAQGAQQNLSCQLLCGDGAQLPVLLSASAILSVAAHGRAQGSQTACAFVLVWRGLGEN
ncbi:putative PAS/PAC sensor protein [Magnetococcus marinus MC-1]|uniref:Putative PAS/PAC sensor protein n=1 Tax=Magnetococcus marinus (strain ATCC BAA-1437 / JCM 17883 / MC-1) TaxID=156889 RepID=A0LC26_MAGMM|nr:response regulator [Magnetococcus marinus]ABK45519.1 putative PAS/PAC sensor protein [Magnetococcus marinus MC-1]